MKRRRKPRHGRAGWLVLALIAVLIVGVASFRGGGWKTVPLRAGPSAAAGAGRVSEFAKPRLIFPYSVVPGGVENAEEVVAALTRDPVVAAHYAGFDASKAKTVVLAQPRLVHVSYRVKDAVYWTKKKVQLHKGEKLVTDGVSFIRSRCGNRISDAPMAHVAEIEPPEVSADTPLLPLPLVALAKPVEEPAGAPSQPESIIEEPGAAAAPVPMAIPGGRGYLPPMIGVPIGGGGGGGVPPSTTPPPPAGTPPTGSTPQPTPPVTPPAPSPNPPTNPPAPPATPYAGPPPAGPTPSVPSPTPPPGGPSGPPSLPPQPLGPPSGSPPPSPQGPTPPVTPPPPSPHDVPAPPGLPGPPVEPPPGTQVIKPNGQLPPGPLPAPPPGIQFPEGVPPAGPPPPGPEPPPTPVPEPSTYVLMGCGLAAMLWLKRRHR